MIRDEGSVVLGFGFRVLGLGLTGGCAVDQGPSKHESPVYHSSPQWVRDKIERGKISEGMTIDQCKLSWPGAGRFQMVSSDSRGWQLWRVENGDRWVYLHVKDGVIDYISDYRRY